MRMSAAIPMLGPGPCTNSSSPNARIPNPNPRNVAKASCPNARENTSPTTRLGFAPSAVDVPPPAVPLAMLDLKPLAVPGAEAF